MPLLGWFSQQVMSDMSTSLLPDVIPETDANPMTYRVIRGVGSNNIVINLPCVTV